LKRVFQGPFYAYTTLQSEAEKFLSRYHSVGTIPVPIELIIERDFGIDIIPVPGLCEFDTVAYINTGMDEIYVDESVYNNRRNRYRFSIAHELAHRILHADIWKQFSFQKIDEWRKFHANAIPRREYDFLEYHANCFAGLVLVPSRNLRNEFDKCMELAKKQDIDFNSMGDAERDIIEGYLAPIFEVSSEVIHRRADKESLWETG
jgi:hypothetical protein